jgi:hypothetical protein
MAPDPRTSRQAPGTRYSLKALRALIQTHRLRDVSYRCARTTLAIARTAELTASREGVSGGHSEHDHDRGQGEDGDRQDEFQRARSAVTRPPLGASHPTGRPSASAG